MGHFEKHSLHLSSAAVHTSDSLLFNRKAAEAKEEEHNQAWRDTRAGSAAQYRLDPMEK